MIEAGNVLLPDPHIALFDPEDLIEEAAGFPNGAHDDQVDATSQALARLLIDNGSAQQAMDWLRQMREASAPSAA
jgi:phage terminase large subunit-like protein